jgi:hypothetical protein
MVVELRVGEQRYRAVSVTGVRPPFKVSRQFSMLKTRKSDPAVKLHLRLWQWPQRHPCELRAASRRTGVAGVLNQRRSRHIWRVSRDIVAF